MVAAKTCSKYNEEVLPAVGPSRASIWIELGLIYAGLATDRRRDLEVGRSGVKNDLHHLRRRSHSDIPEPSVTEIRTRDGLQSASGRAVRTGDQSLESHPP